MKKCKTFCLHENDLDLFFKVTAPLKVQLYKTTNCNNKFNIIYLPSTNQKYIYYTKCTHCDIILLM